MPQDAARYDRAKYACFLSSMATAVTGNLPPLLFITFHDRYGISFSLLGLLVVLNFGTQLLLDLTYSFFSHRFNVPLSLRLTPVTMVVGLLLFAAAPVLFPARIYLGLALGTVVFSAGSGLAEVLVSPAVAAIPDPDPDRMMSRLHSNYAWGVPLVVCISTAFFLLAGARHWPLLTLLLTALPLAAAVLMATAELPPLPAAEKAADTAALLRDKGVLKYVLCIFLGGAAECTMGQWCSGYVETALGVSKTVGDLAGVALFGLMMAIGRTAYAKRGKNIHTVLFAGALGATVCYLAAVLSDVPAVGLIACGLCGLGVSMLWPGSLTAMSYRYPDAGVAMYALMAMGGDMGAALCPQAVGLITDAVLALPNAAALAARFGMSAEQLGMKAAMGAATLFPLTAAVVYGSLRRKEAKKNG